MKQSNLFAKIKKEPLKDATTISHKYLTQADFIEQTAAGVYSFLPLGWKVHKKIEEIIREEMNNIGGQEVYLPALVPKNLWEETGRWKTIDPPLFKMRDRHEKEFGLASTHEEVITDLCRKRIKSYRDLPLYLYQIQDKFRNEMRPTGGLLRVREFIMKDLYSFHESQEDAMDYYNKVVKAYSKIFKRCGLSIILLEADSGTIGGSLSHEFGVLSENGQDKILICKNCGFAANIEKTGEIEKCPRCKGKLEKKSSIELAHAFYLGDKYSKTLDLNFIGRDGKSYSVIMGCYGIGLGRLMSTIVEVYHDDKGIIWPKTIAPFSVHLVQIGNEKKIKESSEKIYLNLQKEGIEVLYDDREEKTAGEKFADSDLIGIPIRLVVSEKTLKTESVEIKKREKKEVKLVKIKELNSYIRKDS
jgi:prolyl-tRNA synthetase